MEKVQSTVTHLQQSASKMQCVRRILLVAGIAIAVVAGLLWVSEREKEQKRQTHDVLQKLYGAELYIDTLWQHVLREANLVTESIQGQNKAKTIEMLGKAQQVSQLGVFAFDANAVAIPLGGTGENTTQPPVPHLDVLPLLTRSLMGEIAQDVLVRDKQIFLCASYPVKNNSVRSVLFTYPVTREALEKIKEAVGVDVSIASIRENVSSDKLQLLGIQDRSNNVLAAFGRDFSSLFRLRVSTITTLHEDEKYYLAATPLSYSTTDQPFYLLVKEIELLPTNSGLWYIVFITIGSTIALCTTLLMWGTRERQMLNTMQAQADVLSEEQKQKKTQTAEVYAEGVAAALQPEVAATAADECEFEANICYKRFYSGSPLGIFHCTYDGTLLQVNSVFASMLHYASAAELLTQVHNITDLFAYPDDGPLLLRKLQEEPNVRHSIKLRFPDSTIQIFHMINIDDPEIPIDECANRHILEGFLIDCVCQEKLLTCYNDLDRVVDRHESLALLLASLCRQTQAYFDPPKVLAGSDTPANGVGQDSVSLQVQGGVTLEPAQQQFPMRRRADDRYGEATNRPERRKGIFSLRAVFDDIYEIALAETGSGSIVETPFDVMKLIEEVQRQALPAMRSKGVSFHTEVEDGINIRVAGPVPLLRYALLRVLLMVTSEVQGGNTYFSVSIDKDKVSSTSGEFVFAASWEDRQGEAERLSAKADQEQSTTAQDEKKPESESKEAAMLNKAVLERHKEVHVLRFLAQKLHGRVVEGAFTAHSRSMQLIVDLDYADGVVQEHVTTKQTTEQSDAPATNSQESVVAGDLDSVFTAVSALATENIEASAQADSLTMLLVEDFDSANQPEETMSKQGRGLNILLIESSDATRSQFSMFLQNTRHSLTEARNGEEGIELFKQHKFDVIFLDMEMPVMDGYQVSRILRAYEADTGNAPTPIVAQTAYVLPEFKQHCKSVGCTDFLAKPLTKHALHTMLNAISKLKEG